MKTSIILSVSFSIVLIILVNNVFALSSVSLKYEEPASAEEVEILRWVKSLPGDALFIDRGSKTSTQASSSLNNSAATAVIDDPPTHYQTAASSHNNVLDAVVGFINNRFQLKHSIELVIGAGRAVYADTSEKIIFIPFTFFKEARERFTQAGKGDLVNQAVADVVLHTVLHELGHLLIAMYEIPIVGREEDAVDALATVLMLQSAHGGAARVEHTAELYKLDREPIKSLRKWDFMGEHSLNIQRHYQIMCHVYGSDPASYQTLKRRIGFSDDRGLICIDEYRQILKGWSHLLEPYLLTQ